MERIYELDWTSRPAPYARSGAQGRHHMHCTPQTSPVHCMQHVLDCPYIPSAMCTRLAPHNAYHIGPACHVHWTGLILNMPYVVCRLSPRPPGSTAGWIWSTDHIFDILAQSILHYVCSTLDVQLKCFIMQLLGEEKSCRVLSSS